VSSLYPPSTWFQGPICNANMSKDKRPYPQDGNREGGLPEQKKPRLSFSRLLFLLYTTTSVMRIEFSSKDSLALRHREKTKRELKSFENAHCVHHCTIHFLDSCTFSVQFFKVCQSCSPLSWQMVKSSWIFT
jgi:hypothetical protein